MVLACPLQASSWGATLILTFQALGVVYGDIGTSPLYVFSSVFEKPPSEEDVIGIVSLIIWTLTAIVVVKYSLIVLIANDGGQGELVDWTAFGSPGAEWTHAARAVLLSACPRVNVGRPAWLLGMC